MSVPLNRTAIVLLASGLSRRYGRHDKLLANLGGAPLIEQSARVLAGLQALTRVAVCPADRTDMRELLINRFVIALNQKPKQGLGHSIAVGVRVALQFKPEAIVLCMGDMPFIEPDLVSALLERLGDVDVVHAGSVERPHPPSAFGPACFDTLSELSGDDGARQIIGQGGFRVAAINAAAPLLVDVDTRAQLDFAERQLALKERILRAQASESAMAEQVSPARASRVRSP